MKPGVRGMHHSSECRSAPKGHRKQVGGGCWRSARLLSFTENMTNEAFRGEDAGCVVNLRMSCNRNFWCHYTYNYQPFVPRVRARHRSQFDSWAAAAALCGEEWERVGGLMWNKNPISTQLGLDLFGRQFSFSLMSSLWLLPSPLCG